MGKPRISSDERAATTERRANAIRRYLAIDRPTIEDIERIAAEAGLSVGRFRMLVRAWRIHGERSLDKPHADEHAVRRAVQAAARPDLALVAPERRSEATRRIGALGRFIDAGMPKGGKAAAHAAEFGGSVEAPRAAAKAWILTPSPAVIPGLGVALPGGSLGGPLAVDVEAIVAQVIIQAGPTASATEMHRRVVELCHAAGIDPPAPATVYLHALDFRAVASATSDDPDVGVCLDRVAVLLDPKRPAASPAAVLSMLFARPSGLILAHRVSAQPPNANDDAMLIVEHLKSWQGDRITLLESGFPPELGWDRLTALLRGAGMRLWTQPRGGLGSATFAIRTFGNVMGGTRIRRVIPDVLGRLTHDPEQLALIRAIVDQSIELHNAARRSPGIGFGPSHDAEMLAEAIEAVFGRELTPPRKA